MDLYELFFKPYENYTALQVFIEVIAVIFGILSVYFSVKKNIWVYPTGIINTALFVYIFLVFGYLGNMLINFYYTIISIYGWVLWAKNREDSVHVRISFAGRKEWKISVILFLLSIVFVSAVYYFEPFINNSFSMNGIRLGFDRLDWANYVDIFTAAIFFVGMWLMAERKVQSWLFWIAGNAICIQMMVYRGLGFTALQYLVFLYMAAVGYKEWKISARED